MAERDFKTGDAVRLKSTGPTMLVNGFIDAVDCSDDMVTCIWFDGDKLRKADIFKENLVFVFPEDGDDV